MISFTPKVLRSVYLYLQIGVCGHYRRANIFTRNAHGIVYTRTCPWHRTHIQFVGRKSLNVFRPSAKSKYMFVNILMSSKNALSRAGRWPQAYCWKSCVKCECLESNWNVMAHGDAREGKWRGNWRMEWVASTLHTSSTWCSQHYYRWCAHLGCQNWCPRLFKWTRSFRRKTKSGFCACAITFQTQSTTWTIAEKSGPSKTMCVCLLVRLIAVYLF